MDTNDPPPTEAPQAAPATVASTLAQANIAQPSPQLAPSIDAAAAQPEATIVNPTAPPPVASSSAIAAKPPSDAARPMKEKKPKVDASSKVKKIKKDQDAKPRKKRKGDVNEKDKTKKKKDKTQGRRLPAATSRGDVKKKKDSTLVNPSPSSMSSSTLHHPPGYSAQQAAVRDMMRRALEEDQYSALGSIVDTDSSSDEESTNNNNILLSSSSRRNTKVSNRAATKLDRNFLLSNVKKHMRIEGLKSVSNFDEAVFLEDAHEYTCENSTAATTNNVTTANGANDTTTAAAILYDEDGEELASDGKRIGKRKRKKRGGRGMNHTSKRGSEDISEPGEEGAENNGDDVGLEDEVCEEEEGSIFGHTVGSSNATWVECDRCKKWRRLRGVVDARKLPSKWFCSMNKNDPERSKCSAPEEEYDGATNTPESDADLRTQKHLRVWVRRLHGNEVFENRMGRHAIKRPSAKEPYEWIRCCNPSCGKWRMLLKSMDGQSVLDSCKNREFYCVMNTWDEKVASCGAAQENLPQVGCPPWVMNDENSGW